VAEAVAMKEMRRAICISRDDVVPSAARSDEFVLAFFRIDVPRTRCGVIAL
jgi:hypothetical protein